MIHDKEKGVDEFYWSAMDDAGLGQAQGLGSGSRVIGNNWLWVCIDRRDEGIPIHTLTRRLIPGQWPGESICGITKYKM